VTSLRQRFRDAWSSGDPLHITQSAVALAALFIAVGALIASCQQNDLYSTQNALLRAQAEPFISVRFNQVFDAARASYADELEVGNYGGPVRSPGVSSAVFLSIGYSTLPTAGRPSAGTTYIPLLHYFFEYHSTNNTKGVLTKAENPDNQRRLATLDRTLAKRGDQLKMIVNLNVLKFTRVEYVDAFGKRHVDVFKGGDRIDASRGEEVMSLFDASFPNDPKHPEFDLDTLTTDGVVSYVRQRPSVPYAHLLESDS
jgi:hypothetical protein